jgi:hypothetical protein
VCEGGVGEDRRGGLAGSSPKGLPSKIASNVDVRHRRGTGNIDLIEAHNLISVLHRGCSDSASIDLLYIIKTIESN